MCRASGTVSLCRARWELRDRPASLKLRLDRCVPKDLRRRLAKRRAEQEISSPRARSASVFAMVTAARVVLVPTQQPSPRRRPGFRGFPSSGISPTPGCRGGGACPSRRMRSDRPDPQSPRRRLNVQDMRCHLGDTASKAADGWGEHKARGARAAMPEPSALR